MEKCCYIQNLARDDSTKGSFMKSQIAVSVDNLTKNFGAQVVLDSLSLEIKRNEIFGILGADGAGKSTLFRILATLTLQDSGECRILGLDSIKEFQKIRAILGYMPGTFSLYTDLSVIENLEFFAAIFDVSLEENYDLIRDIYAALEPFKHRKAGALSGGMKQKLALCCALIHKPQILLLDEPTTGVDMVSRREFWEILSTLKSEMTIIASMPYMDEASMCDRVALLHEGKILSIGAPSATTSSFPHRIYACEFGLDSENFAGGSVNMGKSINMGEKVAQIRALPIVHSCFLFGDKLHVVFKDGVSLDSLNLDSEILRPATTPTSQADTDSQPPVILSEAKYPPKHGIDSSLDLQGKCDTDSQTHSSRYEITQPTQNALDSSPATQLQNDKSLQGLQTTQVQNDKGLQSHTQSILPPLNAAHAAEIQAAFQGAKLYEITPDIEDCFMEFLHKSEGYNER